LSSSPSRRLGDTPAYARPAQPVQKVAMLVQGRVVLTGACHAVAASLGALVSPSRPARANNAPMMLRWCVRAECGTGSAAHVQPREARCRQRRAAPGTYGSYAVPQDVGMPRRRMRPCRQPATEGDTFSPAAQKQSQRYIYGVRVVLCVVMRVVVARCQIAQAPHAAVRPLQQHHG